MPAGKAANSAPPSPTRASPPDVMPPCWNVGIGWLAINPILTALIPACIPAGIKFNGQGKLANVLVTATIPFIIAWIISASFCFLKASLFASFTCSSNFLFISNSLCFALSVKISLSSSLCFSFANSWSPAFFAATISSCNFFILSCLAFSSSLFNAIWNSFSIDNSFCLAFSISAILSFNSLSRNSFLKSNNAWDNSIDLLNDASNISSSFFVNSNIFSFAIFPFSPVVVYSSPSIFIVFDNSIALLINCLSNPIKSPFVIISFLSPIANVSIDSLYSLVLLVSFNCTFARLFWVSWNFIIAFSRSCLVANSSPKKSIFSRLAFIVPSDNPLTRLLLFSYCSSNLFSFATNWGINILCSIYNLFVVLIASVILSFNSAFRTSNFARSLFVKSALSSANVFVTFA